MVCAKESLPVMIEAQGVVVRSARWNGMTATYATVPKGTDFSPVLKGLPDDLCPCPHWGYVLKGSFHVRYKDGREEIVRAGDLYCAVPGHTAWCDEDCEVVEFSPEKEYQLVLDHERKLMGY